MGWFDLCHGPKVTKPWWFYNLQVRLYIPRGFSMSPEYPGVEI
jgi:hypothetical protein